MNRLVRPAIRITQRRCASTSSRVTPSTTPSSVAAAEDIPLANLSLRWKTLTSQQKETVTKQLEQVQMGDWKAMTLEQKKAAYWVAFGPHGARTPLTGPNHAIKVVGGTLAVLAVSTALYQWIRTKGGEDPITKTKAWQEATEEYARENKINPITGFTSEGYKGPGFQHLTKKE
ncbi:Cytochrome c oxidase subunit 5A [Podila minutissima]|nr:Cytochrome c oxidase subunit 5A [Podila minutissima]